VATFFALLNPLEIVVKEFLIFRPMSFCFVPGSAFAVRLRPNFFNTWARECKLSLRTRVLAHEGNIEYLRNLRYCSQRSNNCINRL
jgi:hypothetical protein